MRKLVFGVTVEIIYQSRNSREKDVGIVSLINHFNKFCEFKELSIIIEKLMLTLFK